MNIFESRVAPITELTVPIVLDSIKKACLSHSYNFSEDHATIKLSDLNTYKLELSTGIEAQVDHISLSNDFHAMAFFSLGELVGYLRGINSKA